MTEDEPKERVNSGIVNDGRAQIKKGQSSKFKVGTRVYFDPGGTSPLEGPYLVSTVPSPQRYILCRENDYSLINNGEEIDESVLTRA